MVDVRSLRREVAQLAERQWGHVARRQLLALGASSSLVDSWVRRGELHRVHVGVYALGYRRLDPISRAWAAVLAGGPGAVLSHDSALALWGLRRWPRRPELITPGHVRRPGIRAHRSQTLLDAEVTREYGIPVTRAERAIRDISPRLTAVQRTRLVNDARLAHRLTADEAHGLLGHRRNATRSRLEDDLQRWIEDNDLPQPEINARRGGRELDAVFAAQRIILEMDDYATHGDPASFGADRARDFAHLVDLDSPTVRLTREMLNHESAARLRVLLERRTPPEG